MEYKQFANKYILRLDRGEEIVASLKTFCEKEKISLGSISGLGAVNKAVIGLFNCEEKKYYKTDLSGDFEITSLLGNISTMDGEIYLHLHIALGDDKYNVKGGHLNSAVISGTGELIIEKFDGSVDRSFSEEIGLNLYDFGK